MRTRLFGLFLILILFMAVLVSGQTTCITPVVGVPGQANRPPHWWDTNADPPSADPQPIYHTCLTDPRWVESTAVTYDTGAGEDLLFRLLYDSNFVYLSWWIKSPPFGNPDQNVLYFGFPDSGIGGATEPAGDRIVKVNLGTGMTTEAGGGVAINVSTFLRDPATGMGMSGDAVPTWLSDTLRAWIHKPMVGNCTQNPPDFWAVQVRIPRTNIAHVGNTFKLWYEAVTGTLALPVVKYTWPRTGVDITEGGSPVQEVYPAPAGWNSFQYSSGPEDPMCPAAGVSITWQNIGAMNVPDYRVLFAQVPPAASHPINVFFARPTNKTTDKIPGGGVRGTFRIANWGSMPHWEDGVPIDQLWARIQCGTDGSMIVTDCGTNVPSANDIFNNTTATGANDIHFSWALTNTQLAPFASNAKRADNCLLVELSSAMPAPSPGLVFTRRSVKKNMIFTHTSDFTDSAVVSIKGLKQIAPEGRDIYIWVEALNMPLIVAPGTPVPQIPVQGGGQGETAKRAPRTVSVNDDRLLAQLNAQGLLAQEDLDAAMPTYRVHVYHDTGMKRTIGGVNRPILNAQGVFGYYVAYNPPVTGWRHKLEAAGFTLEELAPNFYRIRKVPNDGEVLVKIYIRSLHEGDQDWPPLGVAPPPHGTGRFRAFLDAGANFPHGDLGKVADGKLSVNAGLEGFVAPSTSIEGILGYHSFKVPFVSSPRIWQLSLNAKQYFGPGPLRFFVNAGVGGYRFDPGNTTKLGGNAGAGVLYDVSPLWGIEGVYNFHTINTSGSTTQLSTVQVGIRHTL